MHKLVTKCCTESKTLFCLHFLLTPFVEGVTWDRKIQIQLTLRESLPGGEISKDKFYLPIGSKGMGEAPVASRKA